MKIFALKLTEQQLDVVNDALMLAPYGRVAPVVAAINAQLDFAREQEANAVQQAGTEQEGGGS